MYYECGKVIKFNLPHGVSAEYVTLGPQGKLWFAGDRAGAPVIGSITPKGGVTLFPLPPGANVGQVLTNGPDGNLWFGESTNKVGRMTPELRRFQ